MATSLNFYLMFKRFLAGMLIGVANIIPGISGATVAILTRQYTLLITALSAIMSWRATRDQWVCVGVIGVGALVGIYLFSWPLDYALTHAKAYTFLALSGLILGALGMVKLAPTRRPWLTRYVNLYTGLGVVMVLSMVMIHPPSNADAHPSVWLLVVSGALAMMAMVIPGISGSLLLVLLGTYSTIIRLIKHMDILGLWPFMLGVVVGGAVSVFGLRWVLNKWPEAFESLVLGAILGSVAVLLYAIDGASWHPVGGVFIWLMGVVFSLNLSKHHA